MVKLSAATRIEATVTITNTPVTGGLIQFNSQGRWWTNNTLASTNWIITTNSTRASATNLYTHALQNPFSNVVNVAWLTATSLLFSANIDAVLSCTVTGAWATVGLRTNYVQTSGPVIMPYPTNITEALRTNQMTALLSNLQNSSLIAPVASGAFSNLIDKTTTQTLSGKTYSGTIGTLTLGAWSQGAATDFKLRSGYLGYFDYDDLSVWVPQAAPEITQGRINYYTTNQWDGAIFSWTNGGVFFGYQSGGNPSYVFTADYLGHPSILPVNTDYRAFNTNRFADLDVSAYSGNILTVGNYLHYFQRNWTTNHNSFTGTNWFARAVTTNLTAYNSLLMNAILQNPIATNLSGSLSGVSVTTIAGSAATLTNVSLREVTLGGSNTLSGDLALTARTVSTLANGYNSGVNIGTNFFVRLSGGTAGVTNAGFVAGSRDGEIHLLEITGGTNFVVLNDSGLEATAGNRIITGTGGTLVLTNNPQYLQVIYNSAASRWRVIKASQ